MARRLTILVEGDTDRLFFALLIQTLFANAGKRMWDPSHLRIVTLDGICNAEHIVRDVLEREGDAHAEGDALFLVYDTDAFEYQKQPPVRLDRVKRIAEERGYSFQAIGVKRNVEDMIAFSLPEIRAFLRIDPRYELPKGLSGIQTLKRLHKEAGLFYIKGNKSEGLLKCLDYSSIAKKYCSLLRPLCDCLGLDCPGDYCRIRRKKR